jgi:hypothetical protein
MTYEQDRDAAAESSAKRAILFGYREGFVIGSDWSRDYWTRWRPVSERPEVGQLILVHRDSHGRFTNYVVPELYGGFSHGDLHWLPIPPLPQTGGEK